MAIIELSNHTPIYQFFSNSTHINDIKYGSFYYSPTNQDKVTEKDFLDSAGEYTQLRAIQVAPYDEYGAYDETRDNVILLYAQTKNNPEDEDNLGYIGYIIVDKDFKINTVQQIVDQLGNNGITSLYDYLGDEYNNIYYFTYDDLGGSGKEHTIIFGNEKQYNTIQQDKTKYLTKGAVVSIENKYINSEAYNQQIVILDGENYYCYLSKDKTNYYMFQITNIKNIYNFKDGDTINLSSRSYTVHKNEETGQLEFTPLNYNLCLVDVYDNSNKDLWSILYIPYAKNEQIEVFVCALLKSTNSKIDNSNQPLFTLGSKDKTNDYNSSLQLYNLEEQSSYFASVRSGKSSKMTIKNFEDINETSFRLNTTEFVSEDGEQEVDSNDSNLHTWPLENKKNNILLKYENCYFSLDGENWYNLPYQVQYISANNNITSENNSNSSIITKNMIDFNELDLREYCELPSSNNFMEFLIQDIDNNSFNNNGNILLKSANTLSVPIINNYLAFKSIKSIIKNNKKITDYSYNFEYKEIQKNNQITKIPIIKILINKELYTAAVVYTDNHILDFYNNDYTDKIQVEINFEEDNCIWFRVYKGGEG